MENNFLFNLPDRYVLWVQIIVDPHTQLRGFSLVGREFMVEGKRPVEATMYGILDKQQMDGKYYPIAEREFMRVCPELKNHSVGRAWLLPVEFCKPFMRPLDVSKSITKKA